MAEDLSKPMAEYYFKTAVPNLISKGKIECSKTGISGSEFEHMAKSLKIVVELRHTLQHGGMPNILRKLKFKDVSLKDLVDMMVPQNYKRTRDIFQSANKLLQMVTDKVIVGHEDGSMTLEGPGSIISRARKAVK